jgi:lipopolysaccharide/colanic/teichoic acid biosynthesis glycosyltransferase
MGEILKRKTVACWRIFVRSCKISTLMILLAGLFLLEPAFRDKITFALSYFDAPVVSNLYNPSFPESSSEVLPVQRQKGHLPEPSTMIMFLGGMGGLMLRFAQKSFGKFKRLLDIMFAAAGLLISAPIFALVALAVWLDSPGPIIYRQNRLGRGSRVFRIYKFRSMRIDAEKGTGAVWAKDNDPRITRVGRILRKCHLDEIPQLFNVIKGEMSIVGPRPERPEIVKDLKVVIRDYEKRLSVKPGITGLAQVCHKYDETIDDVKRKIRYDIFYIKKMCWLFEMRILAQTVLVALTGKGAK